MKKKTWLVYFVKYSLNFRAHALQTELNKVSTSNFVKFQLKSMRSKIEPVFENFHQNRAKKDIY